MKLPPIVASVMGKLPILPGCWLFVQGLNLILARQLPGDVQQAITGKRLRLRIDDAGVAFDFSWRGNAFVATAPAPQTDLTIGASAHDLLLLARRQEDPDTLFFSRRLALEGDTELGLIFKNTLDALELPLFDPAAMLERLPRKERARAR